MSTTHQPRPTMRDVAGRAGVSFKTVSRVVNGEGGVSDVLVARVEQAIAVLGYRPDDRARHLRQTASRTGAIGFILVDVANPFFSSILRGIEEVARKHRYLVLAGSTDGLREREDQLVEAFVARRVDGLIVVPSGPGVGPLQAELERGTPVVFLDLELEGLAVDLVRSDHSVGALLATRHLLAHGHRDIAFFGDDPTIFSAGLRLQGYREAMSQAGLEVDEGRIVHGRYTSDVWRCIIRDYLVEAGRTGLGRPTALFTAQNIITVGATQALHDLELHEAIAQIGFDDIELADVVQPGISVVPQHPRDLGRRAAERLFARIEGLDEPPTQQVIGAAVVERGSGEIPPR
jgi:LacI family transcriptional regulator, galactose operon repressor